MNEMPVFSDPAKLEWGSPQGFALPPGAMSLDFLQAVYRCAEQPLSVRMKAAIAALPFEFPKLGVSVVVDGGSDFAAKLEAACRRSAKVIEARALPPEVPQAAPAPIGREPTPMSAPMPRLRRF
jgi:hypothetical protein